MSNKLVKIAKPTFRDRLAYTTAIITLLGSFFALINYAFIQSENPLFFALVIILATTGLISILNSLIPNKNTPKTLRTPKTVFNSLITTGIVLSITAAILSVTDTSEFATLYFIYPVIILPIVSVVAAIGNLFTLPDPAKNQLKSTLKRHWRALIPITIMFVIFLFSAAPSTLSDSQSLPFAELLGLPNIVIRKAAHFILYFSLGASFYYYFRTLGKFTPGFTSFGSLLFTLLYAIMDEFHQTSVPGRSGQISDILLDFAAGIIGTIIFGATHYLTRSPDQKSARRKQVDKIWQENAKLLKKRHKKS